MGNILVTKCDIRNTGDDGFAIWSIGVPGADNITFAENTMAHPKYRRGSLRLASTNCYAVYGGKSSAFLNNECISGKDADVIFGNTFHKTYGGVFTPESSTRVQGFTGNMGKHVCYFGAKSFPRANAKGC